MKLYFPGHMNKLGMIWDALVSLSNINLSVTSIALFPPPKFPLLLPLSFLSSALLGLSPPLSFLPPLLHLLPQAITVVVLCPWTFFNLTKSKYLQLLTTILRNIGKT